MKTDVIVFPCATTNCHASFGYYSWVTNPHGWPTVLLGPVIPGALYQMRLSREYYNYGGCDHRDAFYVYGGEYMRDGPFCKDPPAPLEYQYLEIDDRHVPSYTSRPEFRLDHSYTLSFRPWTAFVKVKLVDLTNRYFTMGGLSVDVNLVSPSNIDPQYVATMTAWQADRATAPTVSQANAYANFAAGQAKGGADQVVALVNRLDGPKVDTGGTEVDLDPTNGDGVGVTPCVQVTNVVYGPHYVGC